MRARHFIFAVFVIVGCSPHTSVLEISPDSVVVPDHVPDSFDATNKDGTRQVVNGSHLYAHHYAAGWNSCRRAYLNGRFGLMQSESDRSYNRLIQTWGCGIEGWQAGNLACFDAIKASRSQIDPRSSFICIAVAVSLGAFGLFARRGRHPGRTIRST